MLKILILYMMRLSLKSFESTGISLKGTAYISLKEVRLQL
ncbi:hypothetical protein SAMN05444162_0045 [Paenibacillaceae bacterium GAS479]|nr:hypothetical protein SAMN05444162_0045 [Paenibacillaceae bacterium GAS479]